jgi:hypothetical protein
LWGKDSEKKNRKKEQKEKRTKGKKNKGLCVVQLCVKYPFVNLKRVNVALVVAPAQKPMLYPKLLEQTEWCKLTDKRVGAGFKEVLKVNHAGGAVLKRYLK